MANVEGSKSLKVPEKRKAKSQTLLDMDDWIILAILSKTDIIKVSDLKKKMNMSHKGILIHLNRLKSYEMINYRRNEKDYKIKEVIITDKGMRTHEEFDFLMHKKI